MSEPHPSGPRRFADLTPLRVSRPFARLWVGGAVAGVGAQLTIVAIGLHVYEITRDTFAVALVGGIALVPIMVAGIWGGMLADAFDRRLVLLGSAIVGWLATAGLVVLSWAEEGLGVAIPVWPFYLLATLISVASNINGATRSAVTPRLLPFELIPAATALNGISFGAQLTIGPALAGVLVATVGFTPTYLVDVVMFAALFAGILGLPRLRPTERVDRPGWRSLRQGVEFLRRAPNIRMSFLADVIAMTFGRPHALFPALGALVFGGGAITVGLLTAAMAIGTFLAGLFSGPVGHVHRHGVAIARAIQAYGGFVAMLGLTAAAMQTGWFGPVGPTIAEANPVALAIACLALLGMGVSDEISAIFRTTMVTMATPDAMRGRIQGLYIVVVTGGPRLGDLYVGVTAGLIGLAFPPVLGGLLIIALIAAAVAAQRSFREYDARDPRP